MEHLYSEYFAKNLIFLRKKMGHTQEELSKMAKIPRSTLTNFESGSGNPSLSNLIKLSEALHVPVEELLSRPILNIEHIKKAHLKQKKKDRGHSVVFNLLPKPIPFLELERFEIGPDSSIKGVPHIKGSREHYICLKGSITIYVAGEKHELEEGDILIFPGDEKHSYINPTSKAIIGISAIVQNA